eukprot:TRINITY_DN25850_c0_g1_i2.p1 TRINITY_DN25850_c0_g1~~TRINITY_DN25850_c0_g1_i2.p1  ORF type:complete len:585 (+),score=72.82 TRINITY_DN25850_c0_g1_i2:83-1837(+)
MSFHSPSTSGSKPLLQGTATAKTREADVRTKSEPASSTSPSTQDGSWKHSVAGASKELRSRAYYDCAIDDHHGWDKQTSTPSNGPAVEASRIRRRPKLLQGMCLECPGMTFLVRALIIESSGEETTLDPMRIPDLAKQLHPERIDSLSQGLRFLQDRSKSDFLMQPSQHGVMVRSDCMRALVQPRRIIFLTSGERNPTLEAFLDEFRQELQVNIHRAQDEDSKPRAFDLWAVECIVCAVVAIHTLRLQAIKPVIFHVLDKVQLHSQDSIMQLYPLKVTLLRFIEQVRPLANNLHGLIEEYNHPARWRKFSRTSTPGTQTPVGSHRSVRSVSNISEAQLKSKLEAPPLRRDTRSFTSFASERNNDESLPGLEEVLDYWHHNASEVLAEAVEVSSNIEDAMKFIEASLSYSRNELLKLELLAMAISVVLAFGALVTGIWGMNLDVEFMHVEGAFWITVIFIFVVGFIILGISIGLFKNTRNKYAIKAASFGNNQFFRSIGEDGYVLALGNSCEDGALPDDALQKLLRDLKAPALPTLASRELRISAGAPQTFSTFTRRTSGRELSAPSGNLIDPVRSAPTNSFCGH